MTESTLQCPECKSNRVMENLEVADHREYGSTPLTIELPGKRTAFVMQDLHVGVLNATVCADCGFTSFRIADPSELWEAYQMRKEKEDQAREDRDSD